jgi:hypothetical protein
MQTRQSDEASGRSGSPADTETASVRGNPGSADQPAAESLKETGRDNLEQGKQTAAEKTDAVADALQETADHLREQHGSLAEYAHGLSEAVARLADHLRHRSLDELSSDAQALARRNPAVFLVGSVAVGLALSRFMKTRGDRTNAPDQTRH